MQESFASPPPPRSTFNHPPIIIGRGPASLLCHGVTVTLLVGRGVRSDAQLSCTDTQFQKCSQSGRNSSKHPTPCSRPCSLEEQYFKCGIFWDYDAPQRRVSNSEAPVLAGGIPVFLRGSQFSGASELKEGAGEQIKVHQHSKAPIVLFLQLYN